MRLYTLSFIIFPLSSILLDNITFPTEEAKVNFQISNSKVTLENIDYPPDLKFEILVKLMI